MCIAAQERCQTGNNDLREEKLGMEDFYVRGICTSAIPSWHSVVRGPELGSSPLILLMAAVRTCNS